MMLFIKKVSDYLDVIAVVGVALFLFYLLGSILLELSPITTIIGVALLTVLAFDRWPTAILAIAGIALYTASWFTLGVWSTFFTVLICSLGFLVWGMAVTKAISNRFVAAKAIAV